MTEKTFSVNKKDTRSYDRVFKVKGHPGLEIKDKNHDRGAITAELMRGEMEEGFQGRRASKMAEELLELGVEPRQLKFVIDDGKTAREAVEYLRDSSTRVSVTGRIIQAKGAEVLDYLNK